MSEGGSGGALAIGVGDHVFMFENSIYAILSPEGFASIIYKDSSKADTAANLMKLTAEDLKRFKVIDTIIKEKDESYNENLKLKEDLSKANTDINQFQINLSELNIQMKRTEIMHLLICLFFLF